MCPPEPDSSSRRKLARYTPDSRRWRYALAGFSAAAAPILLYYMTRLISSTWSGTLPSLLVLVGAVLTLVSAAAPPTLLLAPTGEAAQNDADRDVGPIAELKHQYASGEISEAAFERRLEMLIEIPSEERQRPPEPRSDRGGTSTGIESERN